MCKSDLNGTPLNSGFFMRDRNGKIYITSIRQPKKITEK